ncbi:hypothetical protein CCR83_15515 [Rhodobacter veldkampii DSM 11550]|nr:hypothetical protein [Phaeovulum veldkampii DSM 11550]TDQ64695.1 uncharacterized protein DUF2059 [Phaeovulum veldkampii DSM 11550]
MWQDMFTADEGFMRRAVRFLAAALLVLCAAVPAWADPATLERMLRLGDLFEVLRDEARDYGSDLESELFPQAGGAGWQAEVGAIHAPERVQPLFHARFAASLAGVDTVPMTAFYASDLGRRVVGLELAARVALLDDAVEEAALAAVEEAAAADDPRLAAVTQFIDAADLIEPNVIGGMNANLAFYRSLAQGGVFPYEVTEADMLSDIWMQEPEVRAEMEAWMTAYLFLAYQPLSDAELAAYTAFSASEPGQRLTRALFDGFGAMFEDVSREMGRAAAARMVGQTL